MIDPALGSQLADLGGFALFLLGVAAAVIGLLRQLWVPGWLYRAVTTELASAREENKELRKAVGQLTGQLARERQRRSTDA